MLSYIWLDAIVQQFTITSIVGDVLTSSQRYFYEMAEKWYVLKSIFTHKFKAGLARIPAEPLLTLT